MADNRADFYTLYTDAWSLREAADKPGQNVQMLTAGLRVAEDKDDYVKAPLIMNSVQQYVINNPDALKDPAIAEHYRTMLETYKKIEPDIMIERSEAEKDRSLALDGRFGAFEKRIGNFLDAAEASEQDTKALEDNLAEAGKLPYGLSRSHAELTAIHQHLSLDRAKYNTNPLGDLYGQLLEDYSGMESLINAGSKPQPAVVQTALASVNNGFSP